MTRAERQAHERKVERLARRLVAEGAKIGPPHTNMARYVLRAIDAAVRRERKAAAMRADDARRACESLGVLRNAVERAIIARGKGSK